MTSCSGQNMKSELLSFGDFFKKANEGAALTVAFFGGSLTWGANASDPNRTSYRGILMRKLRQEYPLARWNFIDAAIGGTGSGLGVYRLERDVLAYNPDLVILDFTLNDNAKATDDLALSAYEAILRKILGEGKALVFPVMLASQDFVTLPDVAELKRRTSHLALYKKYNLPCADVIAGMRSEYQAGNLDLQAVWPTDLFDTTHPHDFGYSVYARHIWEALQRSGQTNDISHVPDEWVTPPTFAHTQRIRLSQLKTLPKGWNVGRPEIRAGTFDFLCSRWQDDEVIAANCRRTAFRKFDLMPVQPEPLSVKFYGSTVTLFGEATVWCGPYQVSIDDKIVGEFDDMSWAAEFSPSVYLVKTLATDLVPDQMHSLTITPQFSAAVPQMLKLESICVAGEQNASVCL